MPQRSSAVLLAFLAAAGLAAGQPPPAPVAVTFELNDAQTKDKPLPGVAVRVLAGAGDTPLASGTTGPDGRFSARLAPGTYRVGYRLAGFVPYDSEATEIRGEGQKVTVSLSRLLEATEEGGREVRIILNWGSDPSQVRDADSHLACACGAADGHVFYGQKAHSAGDHRVLLDVDDTDWGGPETVTLTAPPPGSYLYWVHDYSGPPATLGPSDAVVRVLIGAQQAGEFRVPRGLSRRDWRPFRAIDVGQDGRPSLVPFTADEIAEGVDLVLPSAYATAYETPAPPPDAAPRSVTSPLLRYVLAGALLWVVYLVARVVRDARRR